MWGFKSLLVHNAALLGLRAHEGRLSIDYVSACGVAFVNKSLLVHRKGLPNRPQ